MKSERLTTERKEKNEERRRNEVERRGSKNDGEGR